MGSFIEDLTAQVQQINNTIAGDVQDLKNLATTAGINIAPQQPAPPTAPKAAPANAPKQTISTTTIILGGLLILGAVWAWKKL